MFKRDWERLFYPFYTSEHMDKTMQEILEGVAKRVLGGVGKGGEQLFHPPFPRFLTSVSIRRRCRFFKRVAERESPRDV